MLRQSSEDQITLVAAGVTVHEALAAEAELATAGIRTRVVDAYSIKPLDTATLRAAANATGLILTIEDHYPAGGLGEAVQSVLADAPVPVVTLAVRRIPGSATAEEQRDLAGISARHIVKAAKDLLAVREARAVASAKPL